jgi:serine/threonine protein kinase
VNFGRFFIYLTNTINYIHAENIKYINFKPPNILVKEHSKYLIRYQIYIINFDISRHFVLLDQNQTNSEIAKTSKYYISKINQKEN